jgi:diguanylate cyclase (GGDEF)-like protein
LFTLSPWASDTGTNPIAGQYYQSMWIFSLAAIGLWLVIRGRIHLVIVIAICYEVVCLLEYVSALIYVPYDELRILWFYTNIPGVYIMLGKKAGFIVTVISIAIISFLNNYLESPYSSNALATAISALIYLSIFFHVYIDRSMSYYQRMKTSNDRLVEMATTDPLTGLLNARAYYDLCNNQIALMHRIQSSYSILFIDLDHFKTINDTYGHAIGDLVLKQTANCLLKHLRKTDIIGRIGGEEFSVFLPNTDKRHAVNLAEALRRHIEIQRIDIGNTSSIQITASIGVSSENGFGASTITELQKSADSAMYDAKHAGRNRVSIFNFDYHQ